MTKCLFLGPNMGETSYINYTKTLKLRSSCIFTLYPDHLNDNFKTLTDVGSILSFWGIYDEGNYYFHINIEPLLQVLWVGNKLRFVLDSYSRDLPLTKLHLVLVTPALVELGTCSNDDHLYSGALATSPNQ